MIFFRAARRAPAAHLFVQPAAARTFFATARYSAESPSDFGSFAGPAPPRLPKEDQELFEELQRQSTGAFSSPRSIPQINQSPDSNPTEAAESEAAVSERVEKVTSSSSSEMQDAFKKAIEARGKGEELHPNVRRGALPEFEGDRNPKTGEVGGPKNEPLRWGAAGEWSYNGRTTDF